MKSHFFQKGLWFSLCLLLLLIPRTPLAQAQAGGSSLELTKRIDGDLTNINSGAVFTYLLQYRCVNITEACRNVTVTDVLPPELSLDASDITMIGTVHTTGESYDAATGTVTWTFIDPLPAGSTGELRLGVRFPAGTTLDGVTAVNQAQIAASNQPNPTSSNSTTITAHAQNQLFPQKRVFGGVPDEDTIYYVEFCRPANNSGQLNMSGITMVDTLPDGVTFVSANGGGVYNPGPPQTVTWTLPDFDVNGNDPCITRTVTVRFESANGFAVGDTVTNNVTVTGTPLGAPGPVSASANLPTGVVSPLEQAAFDKTANKADATWGEPVRYGFTVENTGNVSVDNALITDTIPPQLAVQTVHTGNRVGVAAPVTIRYQTSVNAAWVDVVGSPFTAPQTVPLVLAPGDYITMLQWDFGTLVPGFNITGNVDTLPGFTAVLLTTDHNGVPVAEGDIVTNNAEQTYDTSGGTISDNASHDLLVTPPTARPLLQKSVQSGNPVNPRGIITYRVRIRNRSTSTSALVNPVVADLLDSDVEFVTWSYEVGNTNNPPPAAPSPVFEQIDNYRGTGRTLLRWSWTAGAAYAFEAGEEAFIRYQVQIKAGTPAGNNRITNQAFLADWDTSIPRVVCPFAVDSNDMDGDGNTTEQICAYAVVSVAVNTQAVMESAKWVRGDLVADWTRYPDFGLILPGTTFEHRMTLSNVGNVGTTNISVVDILPHLGDTGVIDLSPRESQWQPMLEAPIVAPPGVTVFYSSETNPCRPELVPSGPVGCTPPNWQIVPPADLTTVRSVRFDLGAIVIAPLDSIEIRWLMRAPLAALPGEIAWNSFGFIATRVDNGLKLLSTEPLKVGIAVIAGAVLGQKALITADGSDFVWSVTWINDHNPFPVRVQVTDSVPTGVSFVNGSLNCNVQGASQTFRCEYDTVANEIIWEGILASDQGATNANNAANELVITFTFRALSKIDSLTNQARALVDTDNDNDFSDEDFLLAGALTNVVAWAANQAPPLIFVGEVILTDITLTKIVHSPFAAIGEEAIWTLTVRNVGAVQAQNLVAVDNLPDDLVVKNVQTMGGTVNIAGRTVTVDIPFLDPGQQVVVTITSQVLPTAGLLIQNQARLTVGGVPGATANASILRATLLPRTGDSPWSTLRGSIFAALGLTLLGVGWWGLCRGRRLAG